MRILAAHPGPRFSVHDVHVGWTEALREVGNRVAEYDLSTRLTMYDAALIEGPNKTVKKAFSPEQAVQLAVNGLCAALYRLKPEVLFVTYARFYPNEIFDLARTYGTKIVVMHTESPYEDERQLEVASHADINLVNDPTHLVKFNEVAPTYYMPHSYREGFHQPGDQKASVAGDFVFVGTGYKSRINFFDQMNFDGLDVLLAGNWQMLSDDSHLRKYVIHDFDECLDNQQTVEVYQSCKVGMNLYRREVDMGDSITEEGWSCGPREIEMAACGLFFLRESRGESNELFPMLPTFVTPDDASDELHWYLKHDDIRREAIADARARIADRTFVNRASELMQLLEGLTNG